MVVSLLVGIMAVLIHVGIFPAEVECRHSTHQECRRTFANRCDQPRSLGRTALKHRRQSPYTTRPNLVPFAHRVYASHTENRREHNGLHKPTAIIAHRHRAAAGIAVAIKEHGASRIESQNLTGTDGTHHREMMKRPTIAPPQW